MHICFLFYVFLFFSPERQHLALFRLSNSFTSHTSLKNKARYASLLKKECSQGIKSEFVLQAWLWQESWHSSCLWWIVAEAQMRRSSYRIIFKVSHQREIGPGWGSRGVNPNKGHRHWTRWRARSVSHTVLGSTQLPSRSKSTTLPPAPVPPYRAYLRGC